jgi:acyl-CoA synthetase (NDP forming)
MATGGVETILGVNRDPMFGPVVMFGLGGIFAELLDDVSFRIAPFDHAEAHRMIRSIKGYPLLAGYRGRPASDIDSLADTLVRLSAFAAANHTVEAIDLNPVLVQAKGEGVAALDAVLVTR